MDYLNSLLSAASKPHLKLSQGTDSRTGKNIQGRIPGNVITPVPQVLNVYCDSVPLLILA
jgi:hypothetical protein